MEDFIVGDDVEEDGEEDEQPGQADGEKPKGVEKERRRRKKRRAVDRKLDEDDLDLIKENIGVDVVQRKRLLKHSEKERNLHEDEDVDMKDEDSLRRPAADKHLDDDSEQIDTAAVGGIRRKLVPQLRANFIDQDRSNAARQIFEDPQLLEQRVHENRNRAHKGEKSATDAQNSSNLDDLFDGGEIDDQFATKQDKEIANKDIPERLQLKIGE